MNTIKLAIIGAGGIAQTTHLPFLRKIKSVEIKAIVESNDAKAQQIAEKFKIKHVFNDPEQLFRKTKIDAVMVLTPTNFHLPIATMAARKGIHIFLEKPPVANLKEMKQLAKLEQEQDIIIQIGNHLLFDPNIQLLKKLVTKEEIGEVLYANVGWLQALKAKVKNEWMFNSRISGGGVLMDLGVIFVHTLFWLLHQNDVTEVNSHLNYSRMNKQVEDFATLFLKFKSGTSAVMELSWDNVYPADKLFMKFYGTKGYASFPKMKLFKEFHGHLMNASPEKTVSIKQGMNICYQNELLHFFQTIRNHHTPINMAHEFVPVFEIINEAYRSNAKS